jgi:hypothetical protein
MNLFEKIEMFEKLASELADDTEVSEAIENIEFSNESDHLDRRAAVLNRMRKLGALTKKF